MIIIFIMFNKKKEIKMSTTKMKQLRIKILNNMFACKVKPPKSSFPHVSDSEYTKIESTNGYAINWKGKSFASIIVESVIDQVVKFEKDKVQVKQAEKMYQNIYN